VLIHESLSEKSMSAFAANHELYVCMYVCMYDMYSCEAAVAELCCLHCLKSAGLVCCFIT
jgi:hypothetical protein